MKHHITYFIRKERIEFEGKTLDYLAEPEWTGRRYDPSADPNTLEIWDSPSLLILQVPEGINVKIMAHPDVQLAVSGVMADALSEDGKQPLSDQEEEALRALCREQWRIHPDPRCRDLFARAQRQETLTRGDYRKLCAFVHTQE